MELLEDWGDWDVRVVIGRTVSMRRSLYREIRDVFSEECIEL